MAVSHPQGAVGWLWSVIATFPGHSSHLLFSICLVGLDQSSRYKVFILFYVNSYFQSIRNVILIKPVLNR